MKHLKAFAFALLIASSQQAMALSDAYYSEAMDIDYALADEDLPLKVRMEFALRKLVTLVSPDVGGLGFSIDFTFSTKEDN